jgi:hypothetical protein
MVRRLSQFLCALLYLRAIATKKATLHPSEGTPVLRSEHSLAQLQAYPDAARGDIDGLVFVWAVLMSSSVHFPFRLFDLLRTDPHLEDV